MLVNRYNDAMQFAIMGDMRSIRTGEHKRGEIYGYIPRRPKSEWRLFRGGKEIEP